MSDLDRYTEQALGNSCGPYVYLARYKMTDGPSGTKKVSFLKCVGKHLYWFSFWPGVPIALGLADVLTRAGNDDVVYFDSEGNKCYSQEQAVNKSADILAREAQRLFDQGNFAGAREKFEQAIQACTPSYSNREAFRNNQDLAQSEISNVDGNHLRAQNNYQEAITKYEQAYVQCPEAFPEYRQRYNNNKAQTCFEYGQKLWSQAWEAESDESTDRSQEANEKFNLCQNYFDQAASLVSNNKAYNDWLTIVGLKIEGNELFNEGTTLQTRANQLFNQAQEHKQDGQFEDANEKYKEARSKFTQAKSKFEQGVAADTKFQPCIEFVQQNVTVISELIDQIDKILERNRGSDENKNHQGESDDFEDERFEHRIIDNKVT